MNEALQQLRRMLQQVPDRLLGMSERQSEAKPDAGVWSKKEVLGHLIDSAANNHQRFVRAQIDGDLSFPGYLQESWVNVQAYQKETWESMVQLWTAYNRHLLYVASNIAEAKRRTLCTIGQNPPVTLDFLVIDYVRHLRHHLVQIVGEEV